MYSTYCTYNIYIYVVYSIKFQGLCSRRDTKNALRFECRFVMSNSSDTDEVMLDERESHPQYLGMRNVSR
jgi:hypothetical protein